MLFPSPSKELMQQVSAYAPRDPLSSWMKALPQLIQLYLSRWHIRWTGESLKQGYFSYVLRVDAKMERMRFLSSVRLRGKYKNR
jgi:hypothetical protein